MTLEDQRAQFGSGRFLAMPLAGAIAWAAIGVAGFLLPVRGAALAVFAGTGMIFYLALFIARFTGEDLLGRTRKGNLFDRLFLLSVAMALAIYAIAVPFFLVEPTALPLSVGILTGLMWIPFSGIIALGRYFPRDDQDRADSHRALPVRSAKVRGGAHGRGSRLSRDVLDIGPAAPCG